MAEVGGRVFRGNRTTKCMDKFICVEWEDAGPHRPRLAKEEIRDKQSGCGSLHRIAPLLALVERTLHLFYGRSLELVELLLGHGREYALRPIGVFFHQVPPPTMYHAGREVSIPDRLDFVNSPLRNITRSLPDRQGCPEVAQIFSGACVSRRDRVHPPSTSTR